MTTFTTSDITIRPVECVDKMITGAAGTILESFRKYLSSMPGKHGIEELQESTILDTAHMLRNVRIKGTKHFSCEIGFSWLDTPSGPGPHL